MTSTSTSIAQLNNPVKTLTTTSPNILRLAPQSHVLDDHRLSTIVPLLDPQRHQELVDDIRANGVRQPIYLFEGKILDGRNRWRAAMAANVECPAQEYVGDDALSFVLSLNVFRRQLTDVQRSMVAAQLADLPKGANQHSKGSAMTQQQAADLLGVQRQRVILARKVLDSGAPELVAAVTNGGLKSLSAATKIATTIAKEDQAEFLETRVERKREGDANRGKHNVTPTSGNQEWYTPKWLIDLARDVMGGIDTDPASSDVANLTVGAARYFTAADDGLKQKWSGRVWMNPPFAKELVDSFVGAARNKFDSGEITEACILVNNATDTKWFQRVMQVAPVCFLDGRVSFQRPDGTEGDGPRQGQALIYFGQNAERFISVCMSQKRGAVMSLLELLAGEPEQQELPKPASVMPATQAAPDQKGTGPANAVDVAEVQPKPKPRFEFSAKFYEANRQSRKS